MIILSRVHTCFNNTKPAVSFECVSMEDRLSEPSSAPCRNALRLVTNSMFYFELLTHVSTLSLGQLHCVFIRPCQARAEPNRAGHHAPVLLCLRYRGPLRSAVNHRDRDGSDAGLSEAHKQHNKGGQCVFICAYHIICESLEHKTSHEATFDEIEIYASSESWINKRINVWFVMIGQYLEILRVQKHLNIEKIAFKVVQMKFLAVHITNQKLSFDIFMVGNVQNISMEHALNILIIFCIK